MVLQILRGVFILLAAAVTILYVLPFQADREIEYGHVVVMILLTIGVAGVVIATDVLTPRKRLSAVSGVFLGLIAGLLAAYALGFVVDLIGLLTAPQVIAIRPTVTPVEMAQLSETARATVDAAMKEWTRQTAERASYLRLLEGVQVFIGLITCYISISLVLQTKDDFRFVIPYVEFAKQIRGPRPTVLDTSVIIDGRILEILDTSIMQGVLVVPKFVLNELQQVADSADNLRRARGRRGLDMLKQLQDNKHVEVVIDDAQAEGDNVDQKLVSLCQERRGRLMTNDFNLTKIARLRGVDVTNLNDLTQALRPVVLPGESMRIKLIKSGESAGQGVGYLDDGTMVVVENGRTGIGHEVEITVTSTYQTAAGRMIFGRYDASAHPITRKNDGGDGAKRSTNQTDSATQTANDAADENDQPADDDSSRRDDRSGGRPPHSRNPRRN